MTDHIFSYGTLRDPGVQKALFGRELEARPDSLPGFRLNTVRITDPDVIAASGMDEHPILRRSADPSDVVVGSALGIEPEDLPKADAYEVEDYVRISVVLTSGRQAWVYVAADDAVL